VFKVDRSHKIPGFKEVYSPERKLERQESLSRVPLHRPSATKYNGNPETRLTATMTSEDLELPQNYPLMNTLRQPIHILNYSQSPTVANPFSFYHADQ
jgi:hypothetical protein